MKLAHDPLSIPEAREFINHLLPTITVERIQALEYQEFEMAWRTWLESSTRNTIDLSEFSHSSFTSGTSPAFGEFISRYPTRRVRVSRSDFTLTKILARSYSHPILALEDGPLEFTDCVVLSFPFSGNGSYYPGYEQLLDHADELDVPVFIDGAYFGISSGIDYPLHHRCVKEFVSSLSKHVAGVPLRLGIRFTKELVDDSISASLIGSDVFDRLNAYISIQLLQQFSHEWIINRYLHISNLVCRENNLEPTNTVTIALGGPEYEEFKRGDYRRVCISEELNRIS